MQQDNMGNKLPEGLKQHAQQGQGNAANLASFHLEIDMSRHSIKQDGQLLVEQGKVVDDTLGGPDLKEKLREALRSNPTDAADAYEKRASLNAKAAKEMGYQSKNGLPAALHDRRNYETKPEDEEAGSPEEVKEAPEAEQMPAQEPALDNALLQEEAAGPSPDMASEELPVQDLPELAAEQVPQPQDEIVSELAQAPLDGEPATGLQTPADRPFRADDGEVEVLSSEIMGSADHDLDRNVTLTRNGDDPDRVPVVPTLADDEVPNMPGAILRHAREMLGLTQRDIARKLKLRVNTISDIEHDRLNQPTAAAFVRGHIASYAKYVNIDPNAVLSLYNQNVNEVIEKLSVGAPKKRRPYKAIVYCAIFAAIIAFLAVYFFWNEEPEVNQEPLVIEGTIDDEVHEQSKNRVAVEEGTIVIDKEAAPAAPAPVDVNTQRATEQQQALGTEALSSEDIIVDEGQKTTEALKVQGAQDAVDAFARARGEVVIDKSLNQSAPKQETAPEQPAAEPAPVQEEPAPAPEDPRSKEGELKVEPPPALTAQLKDISSQVSIADRQGLASFNSVQIEVKGPVYVRVTDSRGKILVQGNYQSGNKIEVSGIPPLKVAVSDTAAVAIAYGGGRAVVPAGKQVSFDLPMK